MWKRETSVRAKMSLIDDDETDGCSIIWTIQNFSYCLQKPGECFDSPGFALDTCKSGTFRLKVYPRGLNNTDFSQTEHVISFGLLLEHDFSTNVYFALSIRTTVGSFKKMQDVTHTFSSSRARGQNILKRRELRGNGAETFLDNDTLTLRCRIMKVDDELIPPGQCYLRTIINVEKTTHIWSLEKFRANMSSDEIAEKQPTAFKMPSLVALEFILYRGEFFSGDRIKLEIKQTEDCKPCYLICDLSLLEAGEKVVLSIRDDHWFDASTVPQVWTIPHIPLSKILECEKPYLRCEIVVSSGSEYSWVERVENGKLEVLEPNRSALKKDPEYSDSWKDDLQRFYAEGVLTDMTIRTPSKDFPVHKAILCARSTVFHAMFEQDMEENRTGVVNIKDVDADTVHKMLKFVYSDTVEDLDCDVACKLYFAADKYRITALRRRCSDFLKDNLSVVNVCEVLVLANMHQDEDLKAFVHDFVLEHAAEIMPSVQWKKFKQDHLLLASETLEVLFLRNLRI